MKEYVKLTTENGIGTIEFFHPQSNSLPGHILAELATTITSAGEDENIKALPTLGNLKYGLIKEIFHSIPVEITEYDILHQHGIWMPISLYSKKLREKKWKFHQIYIVEMKS